MTYSFLYGIEYFYEVLFSSTLHVFRDHLRSTEGRWNSSPKGVDFVRHNFEVNCPICGHIYRTNLHIFVAFMCKSHFDYATHDNTGIQDKIFIVQMIADWDLSTYLLRKNSMRWITYNNSKRYDRCLEIPFSWYDYCLTPTRATVELRMIWWTLHDRECNRRNIAWEKIRRKCPELLTTDDTLCLADSEFKRAI